MTWLWAKPVERDPDRIMRIGRIGNVNFDPGEIAIPHANRASHGEWIDTVLLGIEDDAVVVELGGEAVRVTVRGLDRLSAGRRSGRVSSPSRRPPIRLSAYYGILAVPERRTKRDLEQRAQAEVWIAAVDYWLPDGINALYFRALRAAISAVQTRD